jgi:hypothetical protein
MTVGDRTNRFVRLVSIFLAVAGFLAIGTASVNARKIPITHRASYMILESHGTSLGTASSPCSATGCANGIQFHWTSAVCYDGDRYPSIVLVWTLKHKVLTDHWPIIAPCSTGFQFSWDTHNVLSKATWLGSSDATAEFRRFTKQWQQPDGVSIFFQGTEGLTGAEWLKNGMVAASIPVTNRAENVYWYGYTPPSSNLALPSRSAPRRVSAQPATPKVALLGRNPNLQDALTTTGAPAVTNGIDFAWYLPVDQAYDDYRGCFKAAGTWWASPPVAYEYTNRGVLNSRVSVLTCPMGPAGIPLHFNHLNFSWAPSADGTENVLTSLTGDFNNGSKVWFLPAGSLAQPPAGTDGLFLGFHHDNFQSTYWTTDGVSLSQVRPPSHTRMAYWHG